MTDDKVLAPGDEATRVEIQAVWGGALQGGILPAKRSASVLIFSDPAEGEQYGYFDGWLPDDGSGPVFEYTGQGQLGDQEMTRGNKAIRMHESNGTTLRVFAAVGKQRQGPQVFRYLGEFGLDEATPVYEREAPDSKGRTRVVLVFRLRPREGAVVDSSHRLPAATRTVVSRWAPLGGLPRRGASPAKADSSKRTPAEQNSRIVSTRRGTDPVEVERREAELCGRFEAFLETRGHDVCRYAIRVEGEPGIMRTDTCDDTDLILYEAKGASTRQYVREAVAQLADYVRHVRPQRKRCAVLLPARPSKDLCELIESQGHALVYEENGVFIGWPVNGQSA